MATATTTIDRLGVCGPVQYTQLIRADFHVVGNQHGELVIQGYLAEQDAECSMRGIDGQAVSLLRTSSDGAEPEPIFCGVSSAFQIKRSGGVFTAELTVSTGTTLLDIVKKSRSFQDVSMTYQQLVGTVLSDTPKAAAIFDKIANTPIGQPIIQYQETDWEFIKRLASILGTQLLPDCTASTPQFSFGVPGYAAETFLAENYSTKIDKRFYELGGDAAKLYKADFLCYVATSNAYYKLGSKTNFMGQPFYVGEHYGTLQKGELIYSYKLGKAGLCGERLIRNRKLTGLSLDGTVVAVSGETVKLALDIDGGQGAVYPFSWAPETGNMMYCMPKIGTSGSLYLADGDTANAIATTSPRSNGNSCAAMADTQQRCFVTEHGKQMCLYPQSMVFSAGQPSDVKPLQVKLDEVNYLLLESPKAIQIIAKLNLSIEAPTVGLATPQEIQAKRAITEAQAKLSLIIPKGTACGNPPTGGGDTALVMQYQFDALGSQGVLCGTEFAEFDLFDDAPTEFNLAGWISNIILGAAVVVLFLTLAVLTGGASVVLTGALVGAAMGAAAVTATIAIEDYNDGEVRSWQTAAGQILVGAIAGAIVGGVGAYIAPAGVMTIAQGVLYSMLSGSMMRVATSNAMENLPAEDKISYIFDPKSMIFDGVTGGLFTGMINWARLGTPFPTQNAVDAFNSQQAMAQAANQASRATQNAANTFQQSKPSSSVLRQNLIDAGIIEPTYPNAAHHVVAGNSPKAAIARSILQKLGIDINSEANGVFLSTFKGASLGAHHPGLHTNAYYNEVNTLLSQATSRQDALDILQYIIDELLAGTFKY